MLYLLKQQGGSSFFYLINGKEYVVGRKNADIVITNDQSISRQHAVIKVQNDAIKLIDCGSKYGTSLRGNRIEANTEIQVEDQDIIKFGVFQSIYKIEKASIITTGSGLSNSQKNALKKNLEFLGGTFLNNWDSTCTHLTVQEVMLTIKVLLALIEGKPFVTLEYWSKFVENVKENQPLPKVEDFKPSVAEVLVSQSVMDPNPQRRALFKGKTFVFPTGKIKLKMEDLILKTGGKCFSWEEQTVTLPELTNEETNYIFVYSDEVKKIPDSLKHIYEHLKKLGQRTIPVQEIAMAVMNCSCEKDCNPRFDRVQKVFFKQENNFCSDVFSLATETQSEEFVTTQKQEMIIPASLDPDLEMYQPVNYLHNNKELISTLNSRPNTSKASISAFTSTKRVVEQSPEKPVKKIKLEDTFATKQQQFAFESKKRKADENLEAPLKKSSVKENPFAILRKRNNKEIGPDNPFAALRIKQEKILDTNPFVKIAEQNTDISKDDVISSESDSTAPPADTPLSLVSKSKCTNISDIKWLSKNSDVKKENSFIVENFKEIYNKFKNTVVIEVLPTTTRCVNLSDSLDGSVKSEGGKNFKKFKKVRPIKPQSNIILTTISQTSNKAHNDVTILSDGEEDDEFPRPVSNRSNRSRRFDF